MDQMTSHKSYNEPGPRLIGPLYSPRFFVSPRRFFVCSRALVEIPPRLSFLLHPSRCLFPSPACPGPWTDSADGNPSIPLVHGLLRYKLYPGTVEIMKRRSLFEGTCGIRAGALCQTAIIPPAETSEQRRRRRRRRWWWRRRRLDPAFFVPRALEISLARHYVNNECLSQNGPAVRSDFQDTSIPGRS